MVLARGAGPPGRARPGPREGAALGRIRRRGLQKLKATYAAFRGLGIPDIVSNVGPARDDK